MSVEFLMFVSSFIYHCLIRYHVNVMCSVVLKATQSSLLTTSTDKPALLAAGTGIYTHLP